MPKTFIILVLLGGCGDVSTAAAPSGPLAPAQPNEPDPTEPDAEPKEPAALVLELSCNEAHTTPDRVYFYAEAQSPEWELEVFNCNDPEKPFESPACNPASEYVIEGGVIRVLCGEWEVGAETVDYLADFVRIEESVVQSDEESTRAP